MGVDFNENDIRLIPVLLRNVQTFVHCTHGPDLRLGPDVHQDLVMGPHVVRPGLTDG